MDSEELRNVRVKEYFCFFREGKLKSRRRSKRDIIHKNDEMYNLIALDIEDNIEHLRYDKVILAPSFHVRE